MEPPPCLPTIVTAPGLVAGFAWFGNHMEPPFLVACLRIECGDISADTIFAAGRSDDDFVLHDERRDGE